MNLDIRTVLFTCLASALVGSAVLGALWRWARGRYGGIGLLAADFAMLSAGMGLLGLRDVIPDALSFVPANLLIVGASIVGYEGLQRFLGRRAPQAPNLLLLAAFGAVFTYFVYARPDLRMRNLAIAVSFGLVSAQCAWLLLGAGRAARSYTLGPAAAFLGIAALCLVRVGHAALAGSSTALYFSSGTFEAVVLVLYQLLLVLLVFSLTLMVSRRLLADVAAGEAKYSAAFRAAPYALMLTRLSDGKVVEVNDGFVALSGYSREEAVASSSIALQLWARAEDREQVVRELLERGSVRGRELFFRRRSGESIACSLSADVMELGGEAHALSSIQDITGARQSQEALRASEERHRITLASLGDAVISTDALGRVELLNTAAERLTGWSSQQARGRPLEEVFQIVHEQTREAVEPPIARVLREGRVVGLANHTVLLRKGGGEIPIADSGAPIHDAAGVVVGVVLVFRDQTAERLAQAELTAEHARLQAILGAAPAAIFLVDQDERVVLSNAAAASLFHSSDRSGGRCGDLVGCVHRAQGPQGCGTSPDCPLCPLWRAVRAGIGGAAVRDLPLELELEREQGLELRSLRCNVAPLELQGRRGAVLAVHDVTDLRLAQQERERLQASLAQSDRLASMGMLAAGVAHEINNPLSYVLYNLESLSVDVPRIAAAARSCADLLDQRLGAAEAAEALGAAREAVSAAAVDDALVRLQDAAGGARRIAEFTHGLETFSRVEREEVEPVDVVSLLERALTLAHNELKYRARVVRQLSPLPAVLASEQKMAQVLLNLLLDAAHAIEEGRLAENEVRVRTFVDGGQACVEIADTRKDVTPEQLARAFDPFFTGKVPGIGSGLGLSICRDIVTGFGGAIEASSDGGRGVRFVVRLPAIPAADAPRQPAASAASPAPGGVRTRVLVVDDEPEVRKMLRRMLAREFDVVAVASGREALAALDGPAKLDLVLCDVMMPDMSGVELHTRVQELDPRLAARFVFVTAGAFSPETARYLERTGLPRLFKPFEPEDLRRLVLEKARGAEAS